MKNFEIVKIKYSPHIQIPLSDSMREIGDDGDPMHKISFLVKFESVSVNFKFRIKDQFIEQETPWFGYEGDDREYNQFNFHNQDDYEVFLEEVLYIAQISVGERLNWF